ncbi:MAG TPA: FAD:protein FMN transferase [Bacteroidales bacterium]|nr:FAD:protein FMN transferase [Bacteroidales bacterium]
MRSFLSFFLVVILFSIISCKKAEFEGFNGFAQGTTYSIVYESNKRFTPDSLQKIVEKILHDFDMSLSLYIDQSILSKVNRNEDVKVDTFFIEVFKKSVLISEMTGGAFDLTVGPLVRAWGFGPDDHKNFSEQKRDSLMALVGMNKVSLSNGRLVKTDPKISLDFNAIAQGYSVDVVSEYFDGLGIKNYLIEIGGEVRARGTKNGNLWRIGIDRPEDNNIIPGQDLQAIIRITDKSLATSGNYRKFYVEDGIKYSHTIDPKTGYPAKNRLLSATILADDCGTADGIATACMVMGHEKAISFIKSHPELSAYFVISDVDGNFETWISENLKEFIVEEE